MRKEDKKEYKNSYKTPKSYFESFNERLKDKIVAQEFSIPKDDGFIVPNKYLETFSSKAAYQKETKVISLGSYKKYYVAAASVAAIILFVFLFNQKDTSNAVDFNDLAMNELQTYFDENTMDLNSDELSDYLDLENLNSLDLMSGEIEDDTLLDYLNENIDDIENMDYEEYN